MSSCNWVLWGAGGAGEGDDGSASVHREALDAPEPICTQEQHNSRNYWVCGAFRNWVDARDACRSVPGYDLVKIDDAAENDFVASFAFVSIWTGANDRDSEDTWQWSVNGNPIWQGGPTWAGGQAVGGAYSKWNLWEPVPDGGALDCAIVRPGTGGFWFTSSCSELAAYVCEETEVIDEDCDGVNDAQEAQYGLDPSDPADGSADPDGDDVPTAYELRLGGDPQSADSDGDGEADTTDLLTGTDLDGDGANFHDDNCPEHANVDQKDADADGLGDVCDEMPISAGEVSLTTVQVARSLDSGGYALIDTGIRSSSRIETDQNGLLPTGASFRIYSRPPDNSVTVTELWNENLARHAYATSAAEQATWEGRGYEVVGVLGYVSATSSTFGDAVQIRRFERSTANGVEQAVTADPGEVLGFALQGWTEVSALGYGLSDEGRLSSPDTVVRFRRESDEATLHTALRAAEPDLTGYATDGARFRVLPQRNGWTQPLYRLRSAHGFEVLSDNVVDSGILMTLGYQVEGLVGHVYRNEAAVQSLHRLNLLVRYRNAAGQYAHSSTPEEAAELEGQGYVQDRVLGRVVEATAREKNGGECVGDADVPDLIGSVGPNAPDQTREVGGTLTLLSACTLKRVLSGDIVSPNEQEIAELAEDLDAESRAKLMQRVEAILAMTPAEREALLGELAVLDPGNCDEPVDYGEATTVLEHHLHGNGDFNHGFSSDNVSLHRLRAPNAKG